MNDSRLTEEMIEAAAKAIWRVGFDDLQPHELYQPAWDETQSEARAAVEAVLPLLPAEAEPDDLDAMLAEDMIVPEFRALYAAARERAETEAVIRARIADEIETKAAEAESASLRCAFPGSAGQWAHEAALLRKAARIARGSAAATEDSES